MPIDTIAESPSSRNALTHGLFAVRYFIRQGEEEEYAQTLTSLIAELAPQGIIEETFAAEIVVMTAMSGCTRRASAAISPGWFMPISKTPNWVSRGIRASDSGTPHWLL